MSEMLSIDKSNVIELLRVKSDSAVRQVMVRTLSKAIPLYVVNEYPKSGGTWVSQMLAMALGLDFPRGPIRKVKTCVMHGHYFSPFGINNCVLVWRDGRDVMVSWYYHSLFPHDHGNEPLVRILRKQLAFTDLDDIVGNLPKFIDYSFSKQQYPSFSWSDFVSRWYSNTNAVHVKYEAMQSNAVAELMRVVKELTGNDMEVDVAKGVVDECSFARQSGRNAGAQDKSKFLRKGIVGDWKGNFSREAREIFNQYAGAELIKMGYEPDDAWIGSTDKKSEPAVAPGENCALTVKT